MAIELPKETHARAVSSIERYMRENFDEHIGNLQAASLLKFVLAEIGPSIYNRAVAEVQERLMVRVGELDIECHEQEFAYWQTAASQRPR
jgi:uncharacterized protein (DUF2164 family)